MTVEYLSMSEPVLVADKFDLIIQSEQAYPRLIGVKFKIQSKEDVEKLRNFFDSSFLLRYAACNVKIIKMPHTGL